MFRGHRRFGPAVRKIHFLHTIQGLPGPQDAPVLTVIVRIDQGPHAVPPGAGAHGTYIADAPAKLLSAAGPWFIGDALGPLLPPGQNEAVIGVGPEQDHAVFVGQPVILPHGEMHVQHVPLHPGPVLRAAARQRIVRAYVGAVCELQIAAKISQLVFGEQRVLLIGHFHTICMRIVHIIPDMSSHAGDGEDGHIPVPV